MKPDASGNTRKHLLEVLKASGFCIVLGSPIDRLSAAMCSRKEAKSTARAAVSSIPRLFVKIPHASLRCFG